MCLLHTALHAKIKLHAARICFNAIACVQVFETSVENLKQNDKPEATPDHKALNCINPISQQPKPSQSRNLLPHNPSEYKGTHHPEMTVIVYKTPETKAR